MQEEYTFGTRRNKEIVKVKSTTGTSLNGFQQHVTETDIDTTTDTFLITSHYHHTTDVEGNHYDWYEIDHHNRVIDKTPALKTTLEATEQALDAIIISLLKEE